MARIFLVHWNESELCDLAAPLLTAGHDAERHFAVDKAPSWDGFEVDVAVISLDRLPSHGREIADWIGSAKKRRHVPVVFVGGKPEKVAETRARFPNAAYGRTEDLAVIVGEIVATQSTARPSPAIQAKTAENSSVLSTTPLAKKLGIVPGVRFALVDSPRGFLRTLDPPEAAVHSRSVTHECDIVVLFARDSAKLSAGLKTQRNLLNPKASLWLAWPKRTSPLASDLSDEVVRQMGLRAGLVDVKVCAINEDWSGLKFMFRVADRPMEGARRRAKK
jgi:glutaredoxin